MAPCIWITGLSASGKSTFAKALNAELENHGIKSYVLDGDVLRAGLCEDLSLSAKDRCENKRSMSHVAKIISNTGIVPICAIISPYREERDKARQLFPDDQFIKEIHFSTNVQVCAQGAPKGLYARYFSGEIAGLSGLDAPYESPLTPELAFDAATDKLENMINKTLTRLEKHIDVQ